MSRFSVQLRLRRLSLGVASLLFVLFAGEGFAASRWATLQAIHQLENPRNSTKPGRHGELGAYQFRSSTWRMHTKVPFQQALNREVSDTVAVRHYDWIKRNLEAARVPATPYNIALAWNGGLDGVINGTAPRRAHEYASRATGLAEVFHQTAQSNGSTFAKEEASPEPLPVARIDIPLPTITRVEPTFAEIPLIPVQAQAPAQ